MQYPQFIRRLFFYLKAHIGKLVLTSLMMIFATLLETLVPEITGQIVDQLFSAQRDQQIALLYALILFAVITLSALFALSSTAASSWISNKVIMDLRADMFAKLLTLPKSYFDQHSTGRILSKITFDVGQIAATASTIWLDFIKSSLSVVVLIGYLFYKNYQLSLTLIILLPLMYWMVILSANKMRNASKQVQNSMANMTHLLNENINGNALIKIYHAQQSESNKFQSLIKNIRQQLFKVDIASALNSNFVNILIGLSLALVVYFSSTLLLMSAGEFLSFFTAMGMLIKPSKNLLNINKPLQQAMAAGESVFTFIDEKDEENKGKLPLKKSKGEIIFNNVCFAYDAHNAALDNINLEIKAGETVAFVGETGSGKTTLIQLLARFYTPSKGFISIDGVNISAFEINALRTQIAFVDQESRLFNDTVKGNIALGQVQTMADKQIQQAAKIANATHFIEALTEKFNTEIGENGSKLSGGQRQRIAIARAIAKDSPILILDEASSALDAKTEKQVSQAIEKMQQGKTTLIISHRLSTVKKADRIIVLQQGRIIEQGKHQQLLSQNGEYSKLYQHQFED